MIDDKKFVPITGTGGKYLINRCGVIKRTLGDLVIKGHIDKKGAHRVNVVDIENKSQKLNVAKTMLRMFKGNPTNAYQTRHLDSDKSNLHIDNLEWIEKGVLKYTAPVSTLTLQDLKETRSLIGL